MSRAFVKEQDDAFDELPDRPVSPHPNLVTPEGLAAIDAELARLQADRTVAQRAGDRAALAAAARELRYWTARRASAQMVEPAPDAEAVRFGSTVSLEREDGRRQTFRIVGEDEADPARGSVSYVSPLARALMGKRTGDTAVVAGAEVEVLAVD
ncbi:MAG TPA: transcription elongation factor GreA [Caulobacteraceae bacterium]|jgi:transcription elongation GreA/GreB family factor